MIARQFLALPEDDGLVVFAVHPRSAPTRKKRLFARYDRTFAAAYAAELGLPVRAGGRDEDE